MKFMDRVVVIQLCYAVFKSHSFKMQYSVSTTQLKLKLQDPDTDPQTDPQTHTDRP